MARVKLVQHVEFLEEAYRLFVRCGLSIAKTTDHLRETWVHADRRLVSRLVRENGWKQQRLEYLRFAAEQGAAVDHAIADLEALRGKYKTRFAGTKPWTSQDVMQYRALIDQILELRGIHPKLQRGEGALIIGSDEELQAMVQAMQEDEVLGPVLRKRIRQVRGEFEKRLKDVKGEVGREK